ASISRQRAEKNGCERRAVRPTCGSRKSAAARPPRTPGREKCGRLMLRKKARKTMLPPATRRPDVPAPADPKDRTILLARTHNDEDHRHCGRSPQFHENRSVDASDGGSRNLRSPGAYRPAL